MRFAKPIATGSSRASLVSNYEDHTGFKYMENKKKTQRKVISIKEKWQMHRMQRNDVFLCVISETRSGRIPPDVRECKSVVNIIWHWWCHVCVYVDVRCTVTPFRHTNHTHSFGTSKCCVLCLCATATGHRNGVRWNVDVGTRKPTKPPPPPQLKGLRRRIFNYIIRGWKQQRNPVAVAFDSFSTNNSSAWQCSDIGSFGNKRHIYVWGTSLCLSIIGAWCVLCALFAQWMNASWKRYNSRLVLWNCIGSHFMEMWWVITDGISLRELRWVTKRLGYSNMYPYLI